MKFKLYERTWNSGNIKNNKPENISFYPLETFLVIGAEISQKVSREAAEEYGINTLEPVSYCVILYNKTEHEISSIWWADREYFDGDYGVVIPADGITIGYKDSYYWPTYYNFFNTCTVFKFDAQFRNIMEKTKFTTGFSPLISDLALKLGHSEFIKYFGEKRVPQIIERLSEEFPLFTDNKIRLTPDNIKEAKLNFYSDDLPPWGKDIPKYETYGEFIAEFIKQVLNV